MQLDGVLLRVVRVDEASLREFQLEPREVVERPADVLFASI